MNITLVGIGLFALLACAWSSTAQAAVPVDSGYVQVDGGKLYYEMAGQGECIVLIHDGLIHHEVWDNQFYVFAERYRVVRYDRRGYGKSPDPEAPYSLIDDLDALFTQLKIEKARVFGMSAGGRLAIDFTLAHPEKVSGLVLVGAVVSGYGVTQHLMTRGGRVPSLEKLMADPQALIHYFGWEDPYQICPENVEARKTSLRLLQTHPQNVSNRKFELMKPVDRPAVQHLAEIKVPTLVIVGEFDMPDVHAHAGVIEVGIPNAQREIISKAGHLVPLEQPEALNQIVFDFFEKVGL